MQKILRCFGFVIGALRLQAPHRADERKGFFVQSRLGRKRSNSLLFKAKLNPIFEKFYKVIYGKAISILSDRDTLPSYLEQVVF
jgi:hypothetical protein